MQSPFFKWRESWFKLYRMGTRYSARYVMCTLLFSAPHYGFIHNVPRNREEWALFNLIGCLLYFCKYATNVNCSASPGFKGLITQNINFMSSQTQKKILWRTLVMEQRHNTLTCIGFFCPYESERKHLLCSAEEIHACMKWQKGAHNDYRLGKYPFKIFVWTIHALGLLLCVVWCNTSTFICHYLSFSGCH